jgi:hypothetical protein
MPFEEGKGWRSGRADVVGSLTEFAASFKRRAARKWHQSSSGRTPTSELEIRLPCWRELCQEGRGPGRLPQLWGTRRIQHQRSERAAPGSYRAAVSELWEGPRARRRRRLEHRRDGELGPLRDPTCPPGSASGRGWVGAPWRSHNRRLNQSERTTAQADAPSIVLALAAT